MGINTPIFFINDAILFPDLIHALKPSPDSQIPEAATAHDSAYDFFGQEPSSLNILMLVMAGYGIPRSYRHMDGYGVHTYRLVTNEGATKLVRWHWKTLQGKASFLWEEAQTVGGKNADFHRQDMWNAIEAGLFPEWEVRSRNNPVCNGTLTVTSLVSRLWMRMSSWLLDLMFWTPRSSFRRNLSQLLQSAR